MPYNDAAVLALLTSITNNQALIRAVLDSTSRMAVLVNPRSSTRDSSFLALDTQHFVPKRVVQNPVDLDMSNMQAASTARDAFLAIMSLSNLAIQPVEAANLGGAPFTLAKNWDFGTSGNIGNIAALDAEFQYHDPFSTIANGTRYGSIQYATNSGTEIGGLDGSLGLPGNTQPLDPTSRYRSFTDTSMLMYARPKVEGSTVNMGPPSAHNAGDGSITSKFSYVSGGSHLGKSIVWETRMRVKTCPFQGYWFALWTVGEKWDSGPEMDVVESFSSSPESGTVGGVGYHCNSVGGTDEQFPIFDSWFRGLEASGSPESYWTITAWHTYTWIYRIDNTYEVWIDGYRFQRGTLNWAVPQGADVGYVPRMNFLFDCRFGITDISPLNAAVLNSSQYPITYEIDYSRVFERAT